MIYFIVFTILLWINNGSRLLLQTSALAAAECSLSSNTNCDILLLQLVSSGSVDSTEQALCVASALSTTGYLCTTTCESAMTQCDAIPGDLGVTGYTGSCITGPVAVCTVDILPTTTSSSWFPWATTTTTTPVWPPLTTTTTTTPIWSPLTTTTTTTPIWQPWTTTTTVAPAGCSSTTAAGIRECTCDNSVSNPNCDQLQTDILSSYSLDVAIVCDIERYQCTMACTTDTDCSYINMLSMASTCNGEYCRESITTPTTTTTGWWPWTTSTTTTPIWQPWTTTTTTTPIWNPWTTTTTTTPIWNPWTTTTTTTPIWPPWTTTTTSGPCGLSNPTACTCSIGNNPGGGNVANCDQLQSELDADPVYSSFLGNEWVVCDGNARKCTITCVLQDRCASAGSWVFQSEFQCDTAVTPPLCVDTATTTTRFVQTTTTSSATTTTTDNAGTGTTTTSSGTTTTTTTTPNTDTTTTTSSDTTTTASDTTSTTPSGTTTTERACRNHIYPFSDDCSDDDGNGCYLQADVLLNICEINGLITTSLINDAVIASFWGITASTTVPGVQCSSRIFCDITTVGINMANGAYLGTETGANTVPTNTGDCPDPSAPDFCDVFPFVVGFSVNLRCGECDPLYDLRNWLLSMDSDGNTSLTTDVEGGIVTNARNADDVCHIGLGQVELVQIALTLKDELGNIQEDVIEITAESTHKSVCVAIWTGLAAFAFVIKL